MENKLLPIRLPKFRIKEYNSAYDSYFGKDQGWIYCTNFIDNILFAHFICTVLTIKKGLKHEVTMIL